MSFSSSKFELQYINDFFPIAAQCIYLSVSQSVLVRYEYLQCVHVVFFFIMFCEMSWQ